MVVTLYYNFIIDIFGFANFKDYIITGLMEKIINNEPNNELQLYSTNC